MDGLSAYLSFFALLAFLLMSNVILLRMRELMVIKACEDLREAYNRLVRLAASLKVDHSFSSPECPHMGGEQVGAG